MVIAKDFPLDLTDVPFFLEWRNEFDWPVSIDALLNVQEMLVDRYVRFLETETLDDQSRDVVLLGGIFAVVASLRILELILVCQESEKESSHPCSKTPFLGYLNSECGLDDLPQARSAMLATFRAAPKFSSLRNVKNSLRLVGSQVWRLIAPDTVAILHTRWLESLMRTNSERVVFKYPQTYTGKIARNIKVGSDSVAMADKLSSTLADERALDERHRLLFKSLVARECVAAITKAQLDLAGMEKVSLPENLLAGSGGYYISRLIGLHGLRTGKRIERYSHGGGQLALNKNASPITILELGVSSQFVFPTETFAGMFRDAHRNRLPKLASRCEIRGANGDPDFRSIGTGSSNKNANKRRKVLYVPTLLRGERQYCTPSIPDVVYLDWQIQISEKLAQMPVNFTCKLHPGCYLSLRSHPLSQYCPPANVDFEDLLDEVDIFVMDYFQTTTMAQVLCTDKPIVFVELERLDRIGEFETPFRERCFYMQATEDDNNRLGLDWDELEDLILSTELVKDSSLFRAMHAADKSSSG